MNKESSDEKLLKLIEGSAEGSRPQKLGIKFKSEKPARFAHRPKFKFKFNLIGLNKIFFIVAVLLTLIFFYSFIRDSKAIDADFIFSSLSAGASGVLKPPVETKTGFLGIQEYMDVISRRNIFIPTGKETEGPEAEAEDNVKLEDLFKDFKLVGIIWSANPEVMVEDALDKKTYLLKTGEKLGKNQYKIKEITRRSVVFEVDFEGKPKEYELR